MLYDDLESLAEQIGTASTSDPDFVRALMEGLSATLPENAETQPLDVNALVSTHAALALVERKMPHWSVSLEGVVRVGDAHWRCTLRESTARDDDELIGVGSGGTIALSILAAYLRVIARRTRGYV